MEFEDILEELINPGPEGHGEDIFDRLRGAYTGAVEGRDKVIEDNTAAFNALSSENEVLSKALIDLKATKFDEILMAGSPAKDDEDLTPKTHHDEITKGERTTDQFFEKD